VFVQDADDVIINVIRMCIRAGIGFDSNCDQFIQSSELQMAAMKEFGYVQLISCVQISTQTHSSGHTAMLPCNKIRNLSAVQGLSTLSILSTDT